ncbi:MAG: hypothetical protein V4525_13425 [Pseudomonadota bacterium]
MEITDFFPKDGHVQTLYCDNCNKHLDLSFIDFDELITGVHIIINGLPVLHCAPCKKNHFPNRSRFAIIDLHKQAFSKNNSLVKVTRNKTNQNFGYGVAPFVYDSDDYEYIPGLKRSWDEGFLTPVFFNREVLLKYDLSPTYRLNFASTTYGSINRGDDFSMSFGLNKNGKVIMWLGDIAELPESEQYYLRSENINSDHSIGSEFYDGQIECVFTDLSEKDELFKSRSTFLEACFNKFEVKIAHLDAEVLDLTISFNAPIIDTERERRHLADTLNKIYIESFDNKILALLIRKLGGDPQNFGSIKRLQMLLEISCPNSIDISSIMSPFYTLYDLRVAYSHLSSKEKSDEKLNFVIERLGIHQHSNLLDIYKSLVSKLINSFEILSKELHSNSTST